MKGTVVRFEAFFARVAELLDIDSQQELADFLGVNRSAVTQAKRRDSVPQRWILKLSRTLGLAPDWLESGQGPARAAWHGRNAGGRAAGNIADGPPVLVGRTSAVAGPAGQYAGPLSRDADERSAGPCGEQFDDLFAAIPKVRARLCAGGGSFEVRDNVEGYYAFHRSWLQRRGGISGPEHMVLMDVMGNSMEPEIHEGDTVLIDQDSRDVIAGSIYAVGVEDTVMVKRVEKRPGALALLSDNRDYSPIVLRGDELDTVRVVGKVIWIGREYL
ncbi:MAG: LexA family transcriptional regulator [Desulfovibrionaceae bacterium]|jgi:phage repressor protein C with HTH and peptisase S24 domain|nr:LexA family transcriptional regulator [Desulfovibrionaceae bacterium]